MHNEELTRRLFLQGSGSFVGSNMLRAAAPSFVALVQAACTARDAGATFENLTDDEAREFVAIAARILPTTDSPGATEAGAVHFVDKSFGTFLDYYPELLRAQFAEFQSGVAEVYPGAERFSDLDEAEQDAYLELKERTSFFRAAWFLTIAGTFGMASYGGNRNNVGWRLLGMDGPPGAWTYPFGYYDAEYTELQNGE